MVVLGCCQSGASKSPLGGRVVVAELGIDAVTLVQRGTGCRQMSFAKRSGSISVLYLASVMSRDY